MDQAQKEKLLLSNCTWAVTHATRTIEVLRTKHKFKECAAMAKLKAAAAAYLSKVSDEDVAYVEQEKLRAAAEKKRPASNQALVSPAPSKRTATIDLTGDKLPTSLDPAKDAVDVEAILDSSDSSDDEWLPEFDDDINGEELEDDLTDEELYDVLDTQKHVLLNDLQEEQVIKVEDVEYILPILEEWKVIVAEVLQENLGTKPRSRNSRARKGRHYTSTSSINVKSGRKQIEKPPSAKAFHRFVSKTAHNVACKRAGGPSKVIDITKEPYVLSLGFLYCNACHLAISWGNRGPHAVTDAHVEACKAMKEVANDLDDARPLMQKRIVKDKLVGTTYPDNKLNSLLLWTKICARMNASTRSLDDTKVSLFSLSPFGNRILFCPQ